MNIIMLDGRERIVLDPVESQTLIDARDHVMAMRDIAADADALTEAEMDAYIAAAPTPLAFWRKRAGKTQAVLAAAAGVSQPFLAQIEAGKRDGTVGVLIRIAAALGFGLRIWSWRTQGLTL